MLELILNKLMASLRHKTISGMFWSLLQNVGARGLSFIVTIILARLLTPEIFGLIGMLAIFIQVSETIVIAGFSQALIQKKDTDEEDYSSVFWLNMALGILIYAILFLAAPLIAHFYHQEILTVLTRVLALVFVINAFSHVQEAKLRKEMRFKTLMIIHIPSVLIAALVSIVMAIKGMGIWSLVAMELVSRFAYAVQIWIYAKWYPLFVFNWKRVKRLFSFGGKLMLSGVLTTIYKNIYVVLIGRFFSLSSVGYYQTANKFIQTPSTTLSNALDIVAFSAFSDIQDNDEKLKEGYRSLIRQVLFWICPIFVMAAVLATPLFRLLLGEQWVPAVPFFQILCVTGIFYPLSLYNLNLIKVKGRSDLTLYISIAKKIITTIGVILVIPWGIWALVGFQAVNSIFAYLLNSYFSGQFVHYRISEELRDILPVFLLSLLIGTEVFFINHWLMGLSDWIRLSIGFGIGGGTYWAIAWLKRFSPYMEFVKIIKTRYAMYSF